MACVCKDRGGTKRVLFTCGDGDRKTIRLGKMEFRQADAVRVRVEALLAARLTGFLDNETQKWLAAAEDVLHAKLARAGLVEPRSGGRPTLRKLLDAYFETAAVKAGTLTTYKQTRRGLEEHFKPETLLSAIEPLEAIHWRQAMRESGLAEATIAKRIKTARQIFKQAQKWKMVSENPFADVKAGAQTNRSRMYFVSRADAEAVLDACPNAEWRALFALSRFGGLRCPSETLALRWTDIDWHRGRITIRSPKTAAYEGKDQRQLPLFPELRKYLLEALEHAPDRAEFIITRYRGAETNLRTQLHRIIARAGLKPWPKTFHNLRSTRQTELTEEFPAHVVCEWLGNSRVIAQSHYLQVLDAHYQKAAGQEGDEQQVAQIAAQHAAESSGIEMNVVQAGLAQGAPVQRVTGKFETVRERPMTPMGFEPMFSP